jgi:APA family basic amino acid/polyamine antiporter
LILIPFLPLFPTAASHPRLLDGARIALEHPGIGTLFAFALVSGGVWLLRRRRPDLDRPFRTPLVPLVPILGILCCVGLMATLPRDTWIRLLVWLLIGFAVYFGYGIRHSRLQKGA